MLTRAYTLSPSETEEWQRQDPEGEDFRAFTRRICAAPVPKGNRVEIYSAQKRLLEAFTVS